MVNHEQQRIQPANHCDCCDKKFEPGDRAVVVVRIPDGGWDTLCIEDWACIVASSGAYLKAQHDKGQTSVERLIASALDAITLEDD